MTDINKLNQDISSFNDDVFFILNKLDQVFGVKATVEQVNIQHIQGFGSYRLAYLDDAKYDVKRSYRQLEQALNRLHMKVPGLLLNRDLDSIFANTKKIKNQINKY